MRPWRAVLASRHPNDPPTAQPLPSLNPRRFVYNARSLERRLSLSNWSSTVEDQRQLSLAGDMPDFSGTELWRCEITLKMWNNRLSASVEPHLWWNESLAFLLEPDAPRMQTALCLSGALVYVLHRYFYQSQLFLRLVIRRQRFRGYM